MTVRIHLGTEDLANVRFAFSAAAELLASLLVLSNPSRHALHLPWITQVRAIADDFPLLRALNGDSLRDPREPRSKELGDESFVDKIADETVATTIDELQAFLERVGHPALGMPSLF